MLTYKPWQTTQDSAWGEPGNDEIYVAKWKEFLKTPYAEKKHS